MLHVGDWPAFDRLEVEEMERRSLDEAAEMFGKFKNSCKLHIHFFVCPYIGFVSTCLFFFVRFSYHLFCFRAS